MPGCVERRGGRGKVMRVVRGSCAFFRVAYVGLLGVVAAAAATVVGIPGRGAIAAVWCSICYWGSCVAGWRVGCVLLVARWWWWPWRWVGVGLGRGLGQLMRGLFRVKQLKSDL